MLKGGSITEAGKAGGQEKKRGRANRAREDGSYTRLGKLFLRGAERWENVRIGRRYEGGGGGEIEKSGPVQKILANGYSSHFRGEYRDGGVEVPKKKGQERPLKRSGGCYRNYRLN